MRFTFLFGIFYFYLKMSFLAQVIATAGEAELVDLKAKINETERKITSLDIEVKDYMENNYKKFAVLLQENHLLMKAEDLSNEIEQLQNRIKYQVKRELDSSASDVKNLIIKLEETDMCLNIVKQLLDIDSIIKAAEEDQNRSCYLEAAKKFKSLNDLLTANVHIKRLTVYESLSDYISSLHNKFLNDSLLIWNKFITWEELPTDNSKKIMLIINNVDGKSDIIRVLLYYDYLDFEMKLFSKKLYKSVLEPVIKYKTLLKVKSNDGISEIIIQFNDDNFENKPTCVERLHQLMEIFSTLFESLDVFISEDETFVNKLGELLETEFCECLMEYCLYEAVPTKKELLLEFEEIKKEIINFDQFLKNCGFMKSSNTSVMDYVENVNNLFISKTCQSYLVTARKIFVHDLHDIIQVSSFINETANSKSNFDYSDVSLCKSIMQKPTCFISKSTQELLELIQSGLKEISTNENINNIELFYTMRNIISLYCDLMPLKHNALLKSIPQQAALFYNNCMYLAHELSILDIQFSNLLLPNDIITTFVDFVEPLRNLGYNIFNSQVKIQQQQLLEILENSGLSSLMEHTKFTQSVERSLRQCLRQLNLLQSVWQNILSQNIYNKTIGTLCNGFIEKLIDFVVNLTDITLDTSSQFIAIFTVIQNKIPNLFQDPKEVFRHIKKWSKFNELLFILNGSLKDIDDRWANGKGPLAQEFSVDQIKHLIRALFQHTDRRTALLSKIR